MWGAITGSWHPLSQAEAAVIILPFPRAGEITGSWHPLLSHAEAAAVILSFPHVGEITVLGTH